MKMKLFIFCFLLVVSSQAQDINRPQSVGADFLLTRQSDLVTGQVSFAGNEQSVQENMHAYFMQRLPQLQSGCGLQYAGVTQSGLGYHFTFQQSLQGKPIWGTELKVNTDKNFNMLSAFNGLFSLPADMPVMVNTADVWYYNGNQLVPAFQTKEDHYSLLKDEAGTLLYREDLSKYFMPIDTQVQAKVFMPDPLTSAQVTYGGKYIDSNDVDIPELNAQRSAVSMRVSFNNGVFELKNKYFKLAEFSDPNVAPVTSMSPMFDFTRAQDGFEDVNAFYHLNVFHAHIDSLGFGSYINDTVYVDAHALGSSDLSKYSVNNGEHSLFLGEGGVDDGEDPDVILHEYTHYIIGKATVSDNLSSERQAIDEAICDYMAIAYSKRISSFNWKKIFNWDGNNSAIQWYGRDAGTNKKYPYNTSQDFYQNSEIFSGAMADLDFHLGSPLTEKLLLTSLASMGRTTTMRQLAYLILQSDSILYGGQHRYPIELVFFERKILDKTSSIKQLDPALYQVLNSAAFADGTGDLNLVYSGNELVMVSCSDMLGRTVLSAQPLKDNQLLLSPAAFKKGVYFLTLHAASGAEQTLKLVRY